MMPDKPKTACTKCDWQLQYQYSSQAVLDELKANEKIHTEFFPGHDKFRRNFEARAIEQG